MATDLRNTFVEIANAIREKGNTQAKLTLGEMPQAIKDLPSGGTGGMSKISLQTGNIFDIPFTPIEEDQHHIVSNFFSVVIFNQHTEIVPFKIGCLHNFPFLEESNYATIINLNALKTMTEDHLVMVETEYVNVSEASNPDAKYDIVNLTGINILVGNLATDEILSLPPMIFDIPSQIGGESNLKVNFTGSGTFTPEDGKKLAAFLEKNSLDDLVVAGN